MTDFDIALFFFVLIGGAILLALVLNFSALKNTLGLAQDLVGKGARADVSLDGLKLSFKLNGQQKSRMKAAEKAFTFQLPKNLQPLIEEKAISVYTKGYAFGMSQAVIQQPLSEESNLPVELAASLFRTCFGDAYGAELARQVILDRASAAPGFLEGQSDGHRELQAALSGGHVPHALLIHEFKDA